jgi:hypothetical protein
MNQFNFSSPLPDRKTGTMIWSASIETTMPYLANVIDVDLMLPVQIWQRITMYFVATLPDNPRIETVAQIALALTWKRPEGAPTQNYLITVL